MSDQENQAPVFSVVAGNPDETELAAVTAVLTAVAEEASGQRMQANDRSPNAWAQSQRTLRSPIVPGPGAWNRKKL